MTTITDDIVDDIVDDFGEQDILEDYNLVASESRNLKNYEMEFTM